MTALEGDVEGLVFEPAPRAEWEELAAVDSSATLLQTPRWSDCVCADGTFRDASLLFRFAGGHRMVLPLARPARRPSQLSPLGSWPFDWGIGGPVSDRATTPDEVAGVARVLRGLRAPGITVRIGAWADDAWDALEQHGFDRETSTTHVLDLTEGFEHLSARGFRSSLRRNVRKAERAGVEIDRGPHLVGEFCALYALSVERWARQQHEPLALARWRAARANPPEKFATVSRVLDDACTVWIARARGHAVAGMITLSHRDQVKYWRGAMDKERAAPVRANELLHARAIEEACLEGRRWYLMGDSRPGSPLAHFKEGFGAEAVLTARYRYERLPLHAVEERVRAGVKRLIGFRDG